MKLHIDIDSFFVSAHRTIDKRYLNKAVAVGGRSNLTIFDEVPGKRKISDNSGAFVSSVLSKSNTSSKDYFVDKDGRIRGIITTASYEARRYGVKTAMSVREALSLCPHLIMIPPDYELYHELSKSLSEFLHTQTPDVEQFSIDEFFIDVSTIVDVSKIESYAKELKEEIYKLFKLPVSIGIANSKWTAKLATEDAKPFGVKLVLQKDLEEYIKDKDVSEFPGIGKGFKQRLLKNGIRKLGQIKSKKALFYSWKKPGIQLYERVLGIDNEKVLKKAARKSIGMARSFDPISNRDEIKRRIIVFTRYLSYLVYKQKVNPETIFLKIKYEYNLKNKETINSNRIFSENYLKEELLNLFKKIDIHPTHSIIQINITLSNFTENRPNSHNMFELEKDNKNHYLDSKLNSLREKYGIDIIKNASEIKNLTNS